MMGLLLMSSFGLVELTLGMLMTCPRRVMRSGVKRWVVIGVAGDGISDQDLADILAIRSVFAAMMKSFTCNPLILCVHQ